ncbi:MAG: response regulator transcription factor [Armatimonadota bacterium]
MLTVLAVDDERIVRELIARCLSREGYEVHTARGGADALHLARRVVPDLVILDIRMPGVDGIEVCRQLRQDPMLQGVLIMFLTERDAVADRVQGLDAGADDYLPKPFDIHELCARVRALLRRARRDGEAGAGQRQLRVGQIVLDCAAREVAGNGRRIPLSPVQFDLLACLMGHADRVLSPEQLLQEVWGYPPGTGDSGLVRWHIMKLRGKLEAACLSPRCIKTVHGHGYMFTSSPQPHRRDANG